MSSRTCSVRPPHPYSPPAPAESSNADEAAGTCNLPPPLEFSIAEGGRGRSGPFIGLLKALLAEHNRLVTELAEENRRLRQAPPIGTGAVAGHAKAAGGEEGLRDDQCIVFEFAAKDGWLQDAAVSTGVGAGHTGAAGNNIELGDDPALRLIHNAKHRGEQPTARADECVPEHGGSTNEFGTNLTQPDQVFSSCESDATNDVHRLDRGASCASEDAKKRSKGRPRSSISGILPRKEEDVEELQALERCVEGPFDKVSTLSILLNVAFVFVQLQYHGHLRGTRLGFVSGGQWPDVEELFGIIEIVFNIYFIFELALRLVALRMKFFYNQKHIEKLHVFDTFLVAASCLDLYLHVQGQSSRGINLNVLRPFRFLRLLRTLRVIRSVKVFNKLNMLVNTVAASFMALFWSLFLLAVVMLMAALFLCQSVAGALEDESIALDTRAWIFTMYGTSSRALYTVFELTFSGGWPNYARRLVEEVSSLYAIFFFIFIVTVTFAMFRIITALFIRDTLALASSDAESAVSEKMKQKESYAAKLLDFFHAADTSQDGYLTLAEFEAILEDDTVKTWLSLMELDVHDTKQVFCILDTGDGLVSPDEFVEGILRLKGAARSQDVVRIMHFCRKLMEEVSVLQEVVDRVEARQTKGKPKMLGQ